ncbi:MAG: hypothetical protein CEE43_18540 [Promethearchaeota archaeon Loki_b32]|nr:MAG: hypothetical protein CEE43_18540 [Candidatus Lokiarchaeota archaeon Loki_b32]
MNYYTKEALISATGNTTKLNQLKRDDSTAIISEYGGRVLGVFPTEKCYSLLWINPNIKNIISTRNRAIGGDRYWLSPERDFFYKNPESFSNWICQPSLDPANYEILDTDEISCTISSNLFVQNMRTKQGYQGEITRQFKLIREPYNTGLSYCGVEFLDDCILYRPNLNVNGWSLATIISCGRENPGTVLIPTKVKPKPLSYFKIIPKDRLKVEENYVAFKIDVDDIYKLAIRPEDIDFSRPSKIGYVLKMSDSDEYGFLVKLSDDIPKTQNECFDIARDHPDSEIGVIQSYNSESPEKPFLNYGEIELQLNKFETIDNASHGKAKHQLFGYIGAKDDIIGAIEKYLGIENPFLF